MQGTRTLRDKLLEGHVRRNKALALLRSDANGRRNGKTVIRTAIAFLLYKQIVKPLLS